MKRVCVSLMLALLVFAALPAAHADAAAPSKPVLVAAAPGINQIKAKVESFTAMIGKPEIYEKIEAGFKKGTQGKGLVGWDLDKPWGVIVVAQDPIIGGFGYLPIKDLDKFLNELVIPAIGADKINQAEGVISWTDPKGKKQFAKQLDSGYVVITDKQANLAIAPPNPERWFAATIQAGNDVSVRVVPANLPKWMRQMGLMGLQAGIAQCDQPQKPGESDEIYQLRTTVGKKVAKAIEQSLVDLNQIQLNIAYNADRGIIRIDTRIAYQEGSKSAEAVAKITGEPTGLSAFIVPGATMTGNLNIQVPVGSAAKELIAKGFEELREKGAKKIDAESKSDKEAEIKKKVGGMLLDVAEATLASGRVDCAASVMLREGKSVAIAGRSVVEGSKLAELAAGFIAHMKKAKPDEVAAVLVVDGEKVGYATLYGGRVPIEASNDIYPVVGDQVEAAVAIADDMVYAAVGRSAIAVLKNRIEASSKEEAKALPMSVQADLGQVVKFVAAAGKERDAVKAQKALDLLGTDVEDARIRLGALPTKNGIALRLELQKGAIKLIANGDDLK